jgi:hypothetical protein
MANITLSISNRLYKLIKKYGILNWFEIARSAIIREVLSIKAEKEGLRREELLLLMEMEGIDLPEEKKVSISEEKLQARMKERERRRLERLKKVGL